MARGLQPNLWQPVFTICIGDGQVRVLTFAFIGHPVTGDRPDRKRTPFCLRIATGDLVRSAVRNAYGQHRICSQQQKPPGVGGAPAPGRPPRSTAATVSYAAEVVAENVLTSLDYIVTLEEELFPAIEEGGWSTFLGSSDRAAALAHAAAAVSGLALGPTLDQASSASQHLACAAAAVSGVPLATQEPQAALRASLQLPRLAAPPPTGGGELQTASWRGLAPTPPWRASQGASGSPSVGGFSTPSSRALAFVDGNAGF